MSNPVPLVLVTGISGFIGSWVGYTALKLGYRVRGTVRSLANPKKTKHLKELCPGAAHELELVEADLNSEAGWDAAVKDVDYILHVASPFPLNSPHDKYEVIRPAVDGTLYVLKAASRREVPPKRVVITSSVAAIAYGTETEGVVFNDNSWSVADDPKHPIIPYIESKLLAEQAAWKFLADLPENKKFEMATVNPTLVIGPLLSSSDCSSVDIFKNILLRNTPALPNIYLDVVSIFDVVKAHFLAMTKPEANGKRFLVHGATVTFPETSDILVREYGKKGYNPTTMRVSKWILNILSYFDKKVGGILPSIDKITVLDPVNAREILGIKFDDDAPKLIKWIVDGAIHAGLIEDRSPDCSISKTYVRPEIDLTGVPVA